MKKIISLLLTASVVLATSSIVNTVSNAEQSSAISYRYNTEKRLLIIEGSGSVTEASATWEQDETVKDAETLWLTADITSIEPEAFDELENITKVYGSDSLFDTKYETTHTYGGKTYPGTATSSNTVSNINYTFQIKPDYMLTENENVTYYLASGTAQNYYCHNNATKSEENLHTIGVPIIWTYNVESQSVSLGLESVLNTNYSLGFFDNVVTGSGNYYPWSYLGKEEETLVKSVRIEEGVTRLGKRTVSYTTMTALHFPSTLQMLCQFSIMGCTSLTSVTLPGNIASLKDNCFNGCNSLEEIIIQDGDPSFIADDTTNHSHTGVCSISSDALKGLPLKYIFIPSRTSLSGINYLNSSILGKTQNWSSNDYLTRSAEKTDIVIYYINDSDMAKTYADKVGYDAKKLPDSGTVGGNNDLLWTWDDSTNTLSFSGKGTIPAAYSSNTSIDASLPANLWRARCYTCKNGTTIKIGPNIDVEEGAFDNFVWAKTVYTGLKYFKNPQENTATPYNTAADLILDRSRFDVNKFASATPVWGSYTGIQDDMAYGEVDYVLDTDSGELVFRQIDGTICGSLSSSDTNTPRLYPWYPLRNMVTSVSFDVSTDTDLIATKKIGKSFLRYFSNITSITLPDKVEFISDNAFESMNADTKLTSISYAGAVNGENFPSTLTSTGSNIFKNRCGLTSISLPITLCRDINQNAFANCSNLTLSAYNIGNARKILVNDDKITDGIKALNLMSRFAFDETAITAVLPVGVDTADLYIGYYDSENNLLNVELKQPTDMSYSFTGYTDKARELGAAYVKAFLWDQKLIPIFDCITNIAVPYTLSIQ